MRATDRIEDREEPEQPEEKLPDFLNESGAEDTEILTDGGDEA